MIVTTKYNEKDIVWYMKSNKPKSSSPRGFKVDCTYHGYSGEWGSPSFPIIISYLIDEDWINEILLFPSKEELLKSL